MTNLCEKCLQQREREEREEAEYYENLEEQIKTERIEGWIKYGFSNEVAEELANENRYYKFNISDEEKRNLFKFNIMYLEEAYEKGLVNREHVLWMLRQEETSIHEDDVVGLNTRFPNKFEIPSQKPTVYQGKSYINKLENGESKL